MTSRLAKQLIGTFIADSSEPKPSTYAWIQEECRFGQLRPLVDDFVTAQNEPLDANLLLVETVDRSGVTCRIPCRLFDHESRSAFQTDVWVKFDAQAKRWQRLTDH